MADVQVISDGLFQRVAKLAHESARKRMNYNFHESAVDNPHRFLNVLLKGTYVQPHRHADPPKAESFLVLGSGTVTQRYSLGVDSTDGEGHMWGVDLPPGVWHTIVARTERVICFEVKPGPWQAASDKEFAEWAPRETDPRAAVYLEALLQQSAR